VIRSAAAPEYPGHGTYELTDYFEKVRELIDKLPEKRKQVYKLSREGGYSVKEIARELEISVKTVEDHITHAVKFIRKNSSPEGF
jgi:RNA polymerase sigma-70 factor (ECF subfamily)